MGGIKMISQDLKSALSRTEAGRKILPYLHGEKADLLLGKTGKQKWKAIGKGLKKVGAKTSKITERIAKVAAATVGIPPSAIDALKKLDPTTKKKLDEALAKTPAAAAAVEKENASGSRKKLLIIGGAAAVTGLVILFAAKRGKK